MITSASRDFAAATSVQDNVSVFSSPPERSAHSPRSRLIASATPGSFTTSTRNATLARGAFLAACGLACSPRGQPLNSTTPAINTQVINRSFTALHEHNHHEYLPRHRHRHIRHQDARNQRARQNPRARDDHLPLLPSQTALE